MKVIVTSQVEITAGMVVFDSREKEFGTVKFTEDGSIVVIWERSGQKTHPVSDLLFKNGRAFFYKPL